MVQRFFLDGIDLQRGWLTISQTVEFPALIHTDETEAGLAFPDVAMPRAEVAMHAAIAHGFPPASLVKVLRLLKYFQFLHVGLRKGYRP